MIASNNRKAHVDDGDIGAGRRDAREPFFCRPRFPDNFDLAGLLEEIPHSSPHYFVIVEEKHTYSHVPHVIQVTE
jgi:hypothetical protein